MPNTAAGSDGTLTVRFKRAAVFANPHSGRRKGINLLPRLAAAFRDAGLEADFFSPATPEELESWAQREIERGADALFSVGGDGTLHSLVNAAYGSRVTFGVVPAGGGNDFARALGLPVDAVRALHCALSGESRLVDVVKVRTAEGRQRIYLGGGGALLDATTAEYGGTRYRNWPGRLRYIAAAIHAYIEHKPHRVRISLYGDAPDVPWQRAVLASVLNTPTFGAGIRLAPGAEIDDGWVDLAVLDVLPLWRLIRILPNAFWRGTLNLPGLRVIRARKIRIETDPLARFHGDGELVGSTPVDIEVIPQAVRVFAPGRSAG